MRKQLLIFIALIACGFFGYLNYHNCIESDLSAVPNPETPDLSNNNIEGLLPRKSCRIKGFLYRDN